MDASPTLNDQLRSIRRLIQEDNENVEEIKETLQNQIDHVVKAVEKLYEHLGLTWEDKTE